MGAKLTYVYGAMASGKTTRLLQTKYNYESQGHSVHVLKPKLDTKGGATVVSRLGISSDVTLLIEQNTDLLETYSKLSCKPKVILVDEAQFLSKKLVRDLCLIVDYLEIDIICYGIKLTSEGTLFEGSATLLACADVLKEEISICSCGKRATENLRYDNLSQKFLFGQSEICIDGSTDHISYISMCRKCASKLRYGVNLNV